MKFLNSKSVFTLSKLAGCITWVAMMTITSSTTANPITYPSIKANVPYASVAKLTHNSADKKIQYGEDPLQYAMLWKSISSIEEKDKPLIVLIHGGCWLNAFDITHTFPLSTGLSQAGFDVWSLEYRRTGDKGGGWPGTFEDIKQGILKASQYDKRYSLDNTLVIGHSAGGHLALLAGSELNQLKGVIGLAAIVDIEQYSRGSNNCQSATKDFMQGSADDKPKAYATANPVKRKYHPNATLLQGDADGIVPKRQALASGLPTTMIKQAGHFDWIHPGSGAFKSLVKHLENMSNETQ